MLLDPIQELMDEHRIIEKVLTALTAAAHQEVPLEFYERAVDFIANFADKMSPWQGIEQASSIRSPSAKDRSSSGKRCWSAIVRSMTSLNSS